MKMLFNEPLIDDTSFNFNFNFLILTDLCYYYLLVFVF